MKLYSSGYRNITGSLIKVYPLKRGVNLIFNIPNMLLTDPTTLMETGPLPSSVDQ